MDTTDNTEFAELLESAAEIVMERGVTQRQYIAESGEVCSYGALYLAAGCTVLHCTQHGSVEAQGKVRDIAILMKSRGFTDGETLSMWNDGFKFETDKGYWDRTDEGPKTKEQVHDTMMACAKQLRNEG